jgi:hypothetical protein
MPVPDVAKRRKDSGDARENTCQSDQTGMSMPTFCGQALGGNELLLCLVWLAKLATLLVLVVHGCNVLVNTSTCALSGTHRLAAGTDEITRL